MDQGPAQLAERLTAADNAERRRLLGQHADLADVDLAWALKRIYDDVESSDPTRAASVASALSALAEATSDIHIGAVANWTEGMVALDAGEIESAISRLETAEAQFNETGQPVQAASTRVSTLRALAMTGRYDEAIACGLEALDVFLSHNDYLATGKIEQNLGNIHFMCDRYTTAEEMYRLARGHFELVGDQKQLAQIDNCLATTLTSQHRFHEADAIYQQALARAEAAGLEVTQAEIETNQGCLALFQGHFDRALDFLERSRRRYVALGMLPWSATADQELADAYIELNLAPEAAAIYERVTPIFAELGMQAEHARALAYHGRARLALGQLSAAWPLLAEARVSYKAMGNSVGEAMVTLIEAQVHRAEGNYPAASAAAAQAEAPLAAVNAWGRLLQARWLRGDAARAQGRSHEAAQLLNDALRDAEQWSALPVIQRCHASLGLLAEAHGDASQAEAAFKRAIASIERVRAPLPAEEFRTAFLADKLLPYIELVRLCLADGSPSRVSEALGYVERARSRALVDMLGGVLPSSPTPGDAFEAELFGRLDTLREELNWFYSQINRPDSEAATRGAEMMGALYRSVRERETAIAEITLQLRQRNASEPTSPEPLDLSSLQNHLGSHTALVEYFSLDGNLLAFVVTDDGVEVVHLPANENAVEGALKRLHFQLGALRNGAENLRAQLPTLIERTNHHLRALYDALLGPLEERLGHRRLAIVPHRALHYVPFHALSDGTGHVIEQRELCCAPSAIVLCYCLDAPRHELMRATFLGVPDERNPRVRDEVLALAPLFPESVTLLEDRATRTSLNEHSPDAQVLHLACHGRFRPDNPLFSSLQLADGWLTVRDAYRLNLSCELVTLSACETGVSALAPGDELIGLARGFFSAGAPSLLVSLWTVDDEATSRLMLDFYSRLRSGSGPAAALRYALCELLSDSPHPYYWAPFVLMGRW
jgi:CHAT domain-containing protein